MNEIAQVIEANIRFLPVEHQRQIRSFFVWKSAQYMLAKSKKKKSRCVSDINAVLEEFCADIVIE